MKHGRILVAALLALVAGACTSSNDPCEAGAWLEVRPDPIELNVGQRVELDVTLHDCPSSIEDPPITVRVGDPSIVEVENVRSVVGVAPGSTIVTVSTPDQGPFRQVNVTVSAAG